MILFIYDNSTIIILLIYEMILILENSRCFYYNKYKSCTLTGE